MKNITEALNLLNKYDSLKLEDVVKEFEIYSNQEISKVIIRDFRMTGLSNIDFLTSDFLLRYGLKNLTQILGE